MIAGSAPVDAESAFAVSGGSGSRASRKPHREEMHLQH